MASHASPAASGRHTARSGRSETCVGRDSAPNEISKLHSVFTTDARSKFGAEVKMTDASNSDVQLASGDATDRSFGYTKLPSVWRTERVESRRSGEPDQQESDA
jgi:hypothetical protein